MKFILIIIHVITYSLFLRAENSSVIPKLRIKGELFKAGMKKSLVRKRLDYGSVNFPPSGDKWRVKSARGKKLTYLFFKGSRLRGWETTLHRDEYINRSFPLNYRHIRKFMSLEEIEEKWGRADIEYEKYINDEYSLILSYYLRAPEITENRVKAGADLTTIIYKQGKIAEIVLNNQQKVDTVIVKEGKSRQGLIKNVIGIQRIVQED